MVEKSKKIGQQPERGQLRKKMPGGTCAKCGRRERDDPRGRPLDVPFDAVK